MKRLIIATVVLLIAAVAITVIYFKDLSPQAQRNSEVMHTIPPGAAFILEFNNDSSFYDIFKGNQLFASLIGKQDIDDLDVLHRQLLLNTTLGRFFTGQNIFISMHPIANSTGLLLTITGSKEFNISVFDALAKQKNNGLVITTENMAGKKVYTIWSDTLKKRFYLINKEDGIVTGSFFKDLILQSIQHDPKKDIIPYTLIPDQQNSNSLINLYVNYSKLNPLFMKLFANKNTPIFKSFRLFSGLSALTLNFKNNALMFSGLTYIPRNTPVAYLNLFTDQQPVVNDLKNIFPSTTAYSISFGVSDQAKFKDDLFKWQTKAGLQRERDSLYKKIKAETGINIMTEFNRLLGNEFAFVTTKYQEQLGIISVKNGSDLRPILKNISTAISDNTGQFKYNKLPFFLIGDAFGLLKRPYYMIVDNYLILANSAKELASYNDVYANRKFLSKVGEYNQFDALLGERSNVAWMMNIKNSDIELKRDLNAQYFNAFENNEPGWKEYYAMSCQLTASGKSFYTNFCMKLNLSDTTNVQSNEVLK